MLACGWQVLWNLHIGRIARRGMSASFIVVSDARAEHDALEHNGRPIRTKGPSWEVE